VLPLGGLRAELVRKDPASRAVARLEDLVWDMHILQELGCTQACNASANDRNLVPWWMYGPLRKLVLVGRGSAIFIVLEQAFPGDMVVAG